MGPVHFFLLDKYRPSEAFDLAFCNGVFHLKIVRVFHRWSTLLLSENIELREENGEFKLSIAAAGIDPKDLKVQATAEDLLVKGETRHDHEEDRGTIHISEIRTGSLFRVIHLPRPIDPGKVKATFFNGVLLVTAPIAAESRAQKAKGEAA